MGAIADKRLGDFLPIIDAYRPVALTVAAILGLVVLLPGADGGDDPVADLYASPAGAEEELATGAATADGPDDEAAPTTGGVDVGPAAPSGSAVSPTPSRPASAPVGVRPSPGSTPVAASTTGRGSAAAPSSASPAPAPSGGGADGADAIRIAASGWASSTGGAPVPTAEAEGVPEGTLPVGNRVGQVDKVSYVRLAGDGATLALAEDAAGRRGRAFEAPPVQLCQITDESWEAGEAQPMADAPAHDPEDCVPAQRRADGAWSFTLSVFDDPTDARGFALVPTADAPLDFQITFAAQALAA